MNRQELISKLVTILKEVDGSDIVSGNKYYESVADNIISLCGGYYDYCELLDTKDPTE